MAIGLVANAVFVWTTDTRLERQLAAIRAAGDPLTLAELARPPIPPEKNAATYLRRAEAGIEGILREVGAVPGFWQFFHTEDSMPSEIQKALKAAFTAYPDVIPLVQQAAACPDYDAQLDYTLSAGEFIAKMLPVLQNVRDAGRVLQFRVRLLIAEGNCDEAVRTALLLFRLAHHYERNPALTGYLVAATIQGIAVDCANAALQAGPVSKEVRQALDAELVHQETLEGYKWALKSDRVLTLGIFAQFPFRHFWLIGRGAWNRRESEYLDKMRTLLALLREPIPYRQAENIIIEKPYDQNWEMHGDPIGEWEREPFLMVPATLLCAARTQAKIRSLRVLNALQTHAASRDRRDAEAQRAWLAD